MNGRKNDDGKPPITLLPRSAILAAAEVMAHGAEKYGRDNWRGGMLHSRLYDAAARHLLAAADGEDRDPETDLYHLAHLICNAAFLIEYIEEGLGVDDRVKRDDASVDGIHLVVLKHWLTEDHSALTTDGRRVRMGPDYWGPQDIAGMTVWVRVNEFKQLQFVSIFTGVDP